MGETTTLEEFRPAPAARRLLIILLIIRGLLAIAFGAVILVAPQAGATAIALLVVVSAGVWLILDGATSLLSGVPAVRDRHPGAWWTVLGGVVAVLAGIGALVFPLSTAAFGGLMLLWFMAVGIGAHGLLELADRRRNGWMRLLGLLNVVFGLLLAVMLLLNPATALLALIWLLGWYGVLFGIASVAAALRFRAVTRAA